VVDPGQVAIAMDGAFQNPLFKGMIAAMFSIG
jgi:hypothetical protein